MFDWLRKATQSAEISRQERVLDYVDETLSAEARKRFEAELSNDADLQREVAELRTVKAALNALPRQPVPRNFTLDPAKYSKPARAWDAQLYPAMRMATALCAIMFLIVATLTFLPFGAGGDFATGQAEMESAAFVEESAAEVAMVEETEEVSPEMAESLQMVESESAANSARVADEEMADAAEDSAEMVELESADASEEIVSEMMSDDVAADDAAASSAMVEEPATDASSAAASSGPAPAAEAPLQPLATATAIPAPTQVPELATEVFKAAPPLEEETPEEAVADAISAESALDTTTEAADTAPTDNAVAADERTSNNQSTSIRPITLWAIALLTLFLLLLFLTLRTRSRL